MKIHKIVTYVQVNKTQIPGKNKKNSTSPFKAKRDSNQFVCAVAERVCSEGQDKMVYNARDKCIDLAEEQDTIAQSQESMV